MPSWYLLLRPPITTRGIREDGEEFTAFAVMSAPVDHMTVPTLNTLPTIRSFAQIRLLPYLVCPASRTLRLRTPTSRPGMSLILPWEVIERIIDYASNDFDLLRTFSLTCRQLRHRSFTLIVAQYIFFDSKERVSDFSDFIME